MGKKDKRIYLWDNLKFILIFCVVLGHFAEKFTSDSATCKSIFIFIYIFHMPMFFFISGLFYKKDNIKEKSIFYLTIGFILKIVFSLVISFTTKKPISFSLLSDLRLPWFMFVLFALNLLAFLLEDMNKRLIIVMSVIVACFAGYDKNIGDYLYLSRIVIYFPYYFLGTMLDKNKLLEEKNSNRIIKYFISGFIVFLLFYLCFAHCETFYIYRHLLTGRNPFSDQIISYGHIARLLCYISAATMGYALIIFCPAKRIKYISEWGTRTMNVFFWHWPLFLLIDYLFKFSNLFTIGKIGKLVYFLISIVFTIVTSLNVFGFPIENIRRLVFYKQQN